MSWHSYPRLSTLKLTWVHYLAFPAQLPNSISGLTTLLKRSNVDRLPSNLPQWSIQGTSADQLRYNLKMDTIFPIFHHALYTRDGTVLGNLISPIPPTGDPLLLQRFYKDSNVFDIQSDITQYIKAPQTTVPKEQRNAWIDIYVAYWKAIGEILRAESGNHRNDWAIKVYEAWKEVMNLVIRGYGSSGFQSWTLPVLYTAGKYLRVFAIKADDEQAAKVGNGAVKMDADGIGDDVTSGAFEKNERLEDAARVINRVFTLCISDRYVVLIDQSIPSSNILTSLFSRAPMEESRKWGLYHTTNLLFKTYFKVDRTIPLLPLNAIDLNM